MDVLAYVAGMEGGDNSCHHGDVGGPSQHIEMDEVTHSVTPREASWIHTCEGSMHASITYMVLGWHCDIAMLLVGQHLEGCKHAPRKHCMLGLHRYQ